MPVISKFPSGAGAGMQKRTSEDMTVSGATVTAPSGIYKNNASKSVASGTQGTPSIVRTTGSHSVTLTPTCTDTTGYIVGATLTGDAETVSAADVTSGTLTITENGTANVAEYASVSVDVQGGLPEEISTDAAMTALLTAANVGKVYKFVGTTGTYTNGHYYIVTSVSGSYVFVDFGVSEMLEIAISGTTTYAWVVCDGSKHTSTFTILADGTSVTLKTNASSSNYYALTRISLNGRVVASGTSSAAASYTFTPQSDLSVTCSYSTFGNYYYGMIVATGGT